MTSAPLDAASRTSSLTRLMFFAASSLSALCRTPSVILRAMRLSLRRLLLGDAVEGAASRQDMARRQSHDGPAGK